MQYRVGDLVRMDRNLTGHTENGEIKTIPKESLGIISPQHELCFLDGTRIPFAEDVVTGDGYSAAGIASWCGLFVEHCFEQHVEDFNSDLSRSGLYEEFQDAICLALMLAGFDYEKESEDATSED